MLFSLVILSSRRLLIHFLSCTYAVLKLYASRAHFNNEVGIRNCLRLGAVGSGWSGHSRGAQGWIGARELSGALDANLPTVMRDPLVSSLLAEFSGGAIVMPPASPPSDLFRYISSHRFVGTDPVRCAAVMRSIATSLASMHQCGVIHADVKARNAARVRLRSTLLIYGIRIARRIDIYIYTLLLV